MKLRFRPLFAFVAHFFLVLLAPLELRAGEKAEFSTTSGASVKGELIGVYNGVAYIDAGRGRTSYLKVSELDAASRELAARWLTDFARRLKAGAPAVARSDSKLSLFLADKLQVSTDGRLVDYAFESRKEPEFYAFYYSAHWCGPCRRFTPKLRAFYNGMRAMGYDNFEIVFVSSDRSGRMMETYMEEDKMPWPAVQYNKRAHSLVSKYQGNGIPCLVVTDKYGNLLAHSYSGDEYLGPDVPKAHLEALIKFAAALKESAAAIGKG